MLLLLKLEELRSKLLFNSLSDVWFAFCEELGSDWSDFSKFKKFVDHIQSQGIEFKSLSVCPSGSGAKADFAKKVSVLLGDPNKTYVIKTDGKTTQMIRSFTS